MVLSKIDWNFRKSDPLSRLQKLHSYPATLPPQVARKLIEHYSEEGDLVLDLFSGTGTTLFESNILKRSSIGIELNPLAKLISEVKTTFIDLDRLDKEKIKLIKRLKDKVEKSEFEVKYKYWYDEKTFIALKQIQEDISLIKEKNIREFFLIALSDVVRKASKLKHLGFKMHKDKEKRTKFSKQEITKELFLPKVERNITNFSQINELFNKTYSVKVIKADSTKRQKIRKESVDFILTSPPYGDSRTTVAYGEFSRLPLDILNLHSDGSDKLDGKLLGGSLTNIDITDNLNSKTIASIIRKFTKKIKTEDSKYKKTRLNRRLKSVLAFYKDLNLSITHGSYYLKKGKYMVFIVADRTVMDIKLDTVKILKEFLNPHGIELKDSFKRNILSKTMPSLVNASNIPGVNSQTMMKEHILVFKKR